MEYDNFSLVLSQLTPTLNNQNNVLSYNVPTPINLSNTEVSLAEINLYSSFPNITAALNNNKIAYVYNGTTYNLTLPDGIYQISDISGYIQQDSQARGFYLVDNLGNNQYYTPVLTANSTYYKTTLTTTPVPASLPSGWTNPNSIALDGDCIQLIIPSNSNIGTILGFSAGTYPSTTTTTNYAVNGSATPQISQLTSIVVATNIINNSPFNSVPNALINFSPAGYSSGELMTISPRNLAWYKCSNTLFPNIIIYLYDQANNPLNNLDPQISVQLLFRKKKDRR